MFSTKRRLNMTQFTMTNQFFNLQFCDKSYFLVIVAHHRV